MTLKEQIILNHYKTIIEKRAFDEYDILGFLIFIRAWVTNDGVIREFCDLIAHRERNQGRVMRCIEGAIKNDYEWNLIIIKSKSCVTSPHTWTASTVEPICFPRGGNTGFPRMWPLASVGYRPIITLLNVRPMFA